MRRAYSAAATMPPVPRRAEAAGHQDAVDAGELRRRRSPASSSSASTQRRTTFTSLPKPPWESASFRLL